MAADGNTFAGGQHPNPGGSSPKTAQLKPFDYDSQSRKRGVTLHGLQLDKTSAITSQIEVLSFLSAQVVVTTGNAYVTHACANESK